MPDPDPKAPLSDTRQGWRGRGPKNVALLVLLATAVVILLYIYFG